MQKRGIGTLAVVLAFSFVGTPIVTYGDDTAGQEGMSETLLSELTTDAANANDMEDTGEALILENEVIVIEVPENPEEPILLDTHTDDETLEITLPFAGEASELEIGDAGQLEFNNNNETLTSVLPHEDGSLQMVTTILNSSAPTEYSYELNLPVDVETLFQDDGSVLFLDGDGNLLAGAAEPWAKDDTGRDIPTWYEVRGNCLVQVVLHTEEQPSYPIVADPVFGKNLFSWITRTEPNRAYARYNGKLSWWGHLILGGGGGIGGAVAGQTALRTSGWKEWTNKFPVLNTQATFKQQFDCHVTGGVIGLPLDGTYNLESFRPSNPQWYKNVWKHKCNW